MPHTVNGIGTHYYGKKNLQTRPGACEFCRRETVLSSYDTRLWFVVVFIPIIPLGKKHILNYCPKCTRHRVMSLAEWEKTRNQNLSEAMANMSANPQDPQAAMKAHSALVAFGQTAEADKLMLLMKERFANDAGTQAYLGSMLTYLGKNAAAIPYYQHALSLDPELPEAKVAIALDLIQKNQLDEAHKLLQFLEAPGKMEYSGALLGLANGYQRADRHAEALKLFNLLLERYPKLAQDKKFRQAFKKSQTAAGAPSTLPPRKVRWGPLAGLGGAIALVLIAALASNYYTSQHRTLYLVSGFSKPVTVAIPHFKPMTLSNRGLWSLTLPEGKYQATITGATNETMDFSISSTFWNRWFGKPLFILNAGGSALLTFENTTYSANPASGAGGFSFHYGKSFMMFPTVDYPFIPFPERLTIDSHASSVQKTHVEVFPGDPKDAFMFLAGKNRINEALNLAEWHLRIHPEAVQLLVYYDYFAKTAGQASRAQAYYAEAVPRRPVELEWHRMYQESRIASAHDATEVTAEYSRLLQADPTNSSLLYLYGRLQTSKKQAMPLFEKAIAENSSNYFAHFALAQGYMDFGDWTNALPEMSEAARLNPGFPPFEEELYELRLVLKDFSGLEKDLQAALRAKPLNLQTAGRLGEVYIAEGRPEEMEKLLAGCDNNLRTKYPEDAEESMMGLRARMLYATGKFDELAKLGTERRRPKSKIPDKFDALVESGRLQEAAGALKLHKDDPYELLMLSVAWKHSGNEEKASASRAEAIKALDAERPESRIAAGWLSAGQPVALDEILDLSLTPDRKKILLVALAQNSPENSAALLAMARRLNINHSFPFHLINRLTEAALPPK